MVFEPFNHRSQRRPCEMGMAENRVEHFIPEAFRPALFIRCDRGEKFPIGRQIVSLQARCSLFSACQELSEFLICRFEIRIGTEPEIENRRIIHTKGTLQCDQISAMKYRLNILTERGKLQLNLKGI